MAKYGFGVYGIPKYGELDGNRLYYTSNIFGWSYDYQSVSLTWQSIVSDPADFPYVPIAWRLIKSYTGVPDNPYSGEILDSGNLPADFRLTYVDNSPYLITNQEITYVIWVFTAATDGAGNVTSYANSKWINCGSTTVEAVEQTNTQEYFKRSLPAVWLNESAGTGDAIGEYEDDALSKTIDAYAFEYDKIKLKATLLQNQADPLLIPTTLLKNKITDLGFTYEPSLGDTYHRSLYKSGNFINATKGTFSGLQTYATALTHWENTIRVGNNLFLDYNDASFEESVGRWGFSSGATISAQPYATSLSAVGIALTPPTIPMANAAWPMREVGCGIATLPIDVSPKDLKLTGTDPTLYLIPISAGKNYIFKGWVRHLTAAGDIKVKLDWVDKTGSSISSSSFSAPLTTTTSWQEIRSISNTAQNGATAPANAYYANVTIQIAASASSPSPSPTPSPSPILSLKFAFDKFDFREVKNEFSTSGRLPSYSYEDARTITLNTSADRKNYILNPSFDSGTGGWQGFNAEVVQDFNPPSTAKIFGTAVAQVTALSTDTVALVSDWQVVKTGTPYTVGFYVSGPVGRTAKVRIEYSSPQSYDEQTKILSDVEGRYYPTQPYYVDSASVVLSATAQRITAYALSPVAGEDYSSPLVKVSVYFTNAQEEDIFYVDSVMLVESSDIPNYFQGNGGPTLSDPNAGIFYTNTDCNWDVRKQLNMVTNSIFNTTDNWVAASGTTFTVNTSGPLFGTKRGNVSASGGGTISTTVYYPNGACIGGEDVIVSAYVKNVAGLYSISTNGQAVSSFRVSSSNSSEWTRIHVNRIANIGETTFTITISLSEAGSGTKVFYVDGVQAEFGRIATPFIDPTNPLTTSSANLAQVGETISYAYSPMVNAGYSFYGTRYAEKYQRISTSLGLIAPLGSTFAINFEESLVGLTEISGTLLSSPSFELNLNGWTGVSANIKRSISRGTIFDELLSQGGAFCKISSTTDTSFGIITELIPVKAVTGYYTSIAVKPENEEAYGLYSLKLKWYAGDGGFLREKISTLSINRNDRWAYLDIVAPGSKNISVTGAQVTNNYITLTTAGKHGFSIGEELIVVINDYVGLSGPTTIEAITDTTFSFTKTTPNLAQTTVIGAARFNNTGVEYAKIEITCAPTFTGIGRTFDLDKVVFRE